MPSDYNNHIPTDFNFDKYRMRLDETKKNVVYEQKGGWKGFCNWCRFKISEFKGSKEYDLGEIFSKVYSKTPLESNLNLDRNQMKLKILAVINATKVGKELQQHEITSEKVTKASHQPTPSNSSTSESTPEAPMQFIGSQPPQPPQPPQHMQQQNIINSLLKSDSLEKEDIEKKSEIDTKLKEYGCTVLKFEGDLIFLKCKNHKNPCYVKSENPFNEATISDLKLKQTGEGFRIPLDKIDELIGKYEQLKTKKEVDRKFNSTVNQLCRFGINATFDSDKEKIKVPIVSEMKSENVEQETQYKEYSLQEAEDLLDEKANNFVAAINLEYMSCYFNALNEEELNCLNLKTIKAQTLVIDGVPMIKLTTGSKDSNESDIETVCYNEKEALKYISNLELKYFSNSINALSYNSKVVDSDQGPRLEFIELGGELKSLNLDQAKEFVSNLVYPATSSYLNGLKITENEGTSSEKKATLATEVFVEYGSKYIKFSKKYEDGNSTTSVAYVFETSLTKYLTSDQIKKLQALKNLGGKIPIMIYENRSMELHNPSSSDNIYEGLPKTFREGDELKALKDVEENRLKTLASNLKSQHIKASKTNSGGGLRLKMTFDGLEAGKNRTLESELDAMGIKYRIEDDEKVSISNADAQKFSDNLPLMEIKGHLKELGVNSEFSKGKINVTVDQKFLAHMPNKNLKIGEKTELSLEEAKTLLDGIQKDEIKECLDKLKLSSPVGSDNKLMIKSTVTDFNSPNHVRNILKTLEKAGIGCKISSQDKNSIIINPTSISKLHLYLKTEESLVNNVNAKLNNLLEDKDNRNWGASIKREGIGSYRIVMPKSSNMNVKLTSVYNILKSVSENPSEYPNLDDEYIKNMNLDETIKFKEVGYNNQLNGIESLLRLSNGMDRSQKACALCTSLIRKIIPDTNVKFEVIPGRKTANDVYRQAELFKIISALEACTQSKPFNQNSQEYKEAVRAYNSWFVGMGAYSNNDINVGLGDQKNRRDILAEVNGNSYNVSTDVSKKMMEGAIGYCKTAFVERFKTSYDFAKKIDQEQGDVFLGVEAINISTTSDAVMKLMEICYVSCELKAFNGEVKTFLSDSRRVGAEHKSNLNIDKEWGKVAQVLIEINTVFQSLPAGTLDLETVLNGVKALDKPHSSDKESYSLDKLYEVYREQVGEEVEGFCRQLGNFSDGTPISGDVIYKEKMEAFKKYKGTDVIRIDKLRNDAVSYLLSRYGSPEASSLYIPEINARRKELATLQSKNGDVKFLGALGLSDDEAVRKYKDPQGNWQYHLIDNDLDRIVFNKKKDEIANVITLKNKINNSQTELKEINGRKGAETPNKAILDQVNSTLNLDPRNSIVVNAKEYSKNWVNFFQTNFSSLYQSRYCENYTDLIDKLQYGEDLSSEGAVTLVDKIIDELVNNYGSWKLKDCDYCEEPYMLSTNYFPQYYQRLVAVQITNDLSHKAVEHDNDAFDNMARDRMRQEYRFGEFNNTYSSKVYRYGEVVEEKRPDLFSIFAFEKAKKYLANPPRFFSGNINTKERNQLVKQKAFVEFMRAQSPFFYPRPRNVDLPSVRVPRVMEVEKSVKKDLETQMLRYKKSQVSQTTS